MSIVESIKGLGKGGIAGLIAVLVAIGIGFFIAGARWVNTSPSQCASCHPQMTELWRSSLTHSAEKVTCHECHSAHPEMKSKFTAIPAFVRDAFIPEKYMASAERLESRCIECHADIPGAETEQAKLIRVNHKAHMAQAINQSGRMIELGCNDCHFNIAHDKAEEETNRPPMSSCFVGECHQKERNRDRCQMCHYQMLVDLKPEGL